MTDVEFRNVQKAYHSKLVLRDVNMTIEQGSFTVIYGAPACGKSLLLRLLAGLEKQDKGQIFMRGVDVTHLSPEKRNLDYVPQSFALYPHYSVSDNIAYPLTLAGMKKSAIRPIVERTAASLKISHLLKKFPNQLSGGEKQRVAIARGIVKDSKIFILDDPLTGLDFKLREQLFEDLRQMKDDLQATFIYTTSDALETLMIAEQIKILDHGEIIEAGNLEDVYRKPQHLRTMSMLGFPEANVFQGKVYHENGCVRLQTTILDFEVHFDQVDTAFPDGMTVNIALRPQDIKINPKQPNGMSLFKAEITLVEDLGGEMIGYIEANGMLLRAVVGHGVGKMAESISTIGIHPDALVVYAAATGQRIGQGRK